MTVRRFAVGGFNTATFVKQNVFSTLCRSA